MLDDMFEQLSPSEMGEMEKLVAQSKNIDLIAVFFFMGGWPSKIAEHVAAYADRKIGEDEYMDALTALKRYSVFLKKKEVKERARRIYKRLEEGRCYGKEKGRCSFYLAENFGIPLPARFVSKAVCREVFERLKERKLDSAEELIKKYKDRLKRSSLKESIISGLQVAIRYPSISKEHGMEREYPFPRFGRYLDSNDVCYAIVMAIDACNIKKEDVSLLTKQFGRYLTKEGAAYGLERLVDDAFDIQLPHSLSSALTTLDALGRLVKEADRKSLINKIMKKQFEYFRPGTTENIAGVMVRTEPEHGYNGAFETLEKYSRYADRGLAAKIVYRVLEDRFYDGDVKRAKKIISEFRGILDQDRISKALADAVEKRLETALEEIPGLIKSFQKYVKRERIEDAVRRAFETDYSRKFFGSCGRIMDCMRKHISEDSLREYALKIIEGELYSRIYGVETALKYIEKYKGILEQSAIERVMLMAIKRKLDNGRVDHALDMFAAFKDYVPESRERRYLAILSELKTKRLADITQYSRK